MVEQVKANLNDIYENNIDEFCEVAELIRDSFMDSKLPNLTKAEEILLIKLAYYGTCVIAARAIGREA